MLIVTQVDCGLADNLGKPLASTVESMQGGTEGAADHGTLVILLQLKNETRHRKPRRCRVLG